nr:hypothetical protein [uncultured Flavobacterium sp.]
MRKLLRNNFVLAFASLAVLTSCNDDEDTTLERGFKPTITAEQTSFSVTEGDVVTLNLSTSQAINDNMDLKLELIDGTGSFRDYTVDGTETTVTDGWGMIGHKLSFPIYADNYSVDITPIFDLLPEGTETLVLKLSSMGNSKGIVAENSQIITITVANQTSNDFVAIADWSQTTTNAHGNLVAGEYEGADGNSHEYCDFDFDLELYDSGFNIVADDYNNCPAEVTLDESAPDDTYYIVPSFWTNAGPAAPAEDINFKMKVTMAKPGVWIHEVNIDDIWTYEQGGVDDGFADGYQIAGVLIKTGTTYELQDLDGNVLAQGKIADFKLKSKKTRK